MGDVEILARLAQVGRSQAQRVQHALERIDGAGHRVARGKLAVRGVGAALLGAPLFAHLAQRGHDVGDGKVAHGV